MKGFLGRVLRVATGLAALWLCEALFTVVEGSPTAPHLLFKGLAASYFGAFVLYVPLAFVLATLGPSLASVRHGVERHIRTIRERLRDRSQERSVSASLLAFAATLACTSYGSYRVSFALVVGIVQPTNAALAIVLVHWALAALSLPLYWLWHAALVRAFAALGRLCGGRSWLDRVPFVVSCLAASVLALSVLAVVRFSTLIDAMPWRAIGRGSAACVAFLGAILLLSRAAIRVAAVGLCLLWLACAYPAFKLTRADEAALAIMNEVAPSALANRILARTTDVDGDGYHTLLGGGDCQPRNAAVHPGAREIPDNGRDEDCDGRDLTVPTFLSAPEPPMAAVPAAIPAKPSIILITLDTFAAAHLKEFGYEHNPAPNIGALIKRGVLFDHCFTAGPATRLSFPSMFTGLFDSDIEVDLSKRRFPFPVAARHLTLAEMLRSAGYQTEAVIPIPYFTSRDWPGLNQGFDHVDETTIKKAGAARPVSADFATEAAIARIRASDAKRPLFMWVHYFDLHAPDGVPEGMQARDKSREAEYDAQLTFVDQHLGTLLDTVRKELGEQALVVLTGDHGRGFGGQRYASAGYGHDLHSITLHVPMVFQASFLAPRRVDSLCSTLDLAPTVRNVLRMPTLRGLRGYSLVPELTEGKVARPQVTFHEQYLPERIARGEEPLVRVGVRTERYNYLLDRRTNVAGLWDYRADYAEKRDLTRDGSNRESVRAELAALMAAFVYEAERSMARPSKAPPKKHAPSPRAHVDAH